MNRRERCFKSLFSQEKARLRIKCPYFISLETLKLLQNIRIDDLSEISAVLPWYRVYYVQSLDVKGKEWINRASHFVDFSRELHVFTVIES